MTILEFMKNNTVVLDGGMGTLLQRAGLTAGEHPERWNITRPEAVVGIHRDYFDCGSNVVNTNTFGANALRFSEGELEEIIAAAVENAKRAREASTAEGEKFISLDIGPTGKLLKPLGDLEFEAAVEAFAKTVRLGVKYGVDLVTVETFNDSYETKAAVLAVKENSDLPVFVSNAYSEDMKLMTGASPSAMVALLEGLGVDALGANCSLGPVQLRGVVDELLRCSSLPVILKPNAGLPRIENGETVFDVGARAFGDEILSAVNKGVRIVGGCCGTTPEYISAVTEKIKGTKPRELIKKNTTSVSSYTHSVEFGASPVLIGERINPTGKKRFKQALVENDIAYILSEGVGQTEKGVHILDVNVGLPEIDERTMLVHTVKELQAVTDLPLQIDTSSIDAMEAALRIYNGKALINSVNGKAESMDAIFPLVKKYGGAVIALTLDENGIPDTVEGRVAIAQRILARAEAYGIDKKDIIFDTLAMTVSADSNAGNVTLGALRKIREELGCYTSLGVSNISFGLPSRELVNSTFFALALESGLSAAIMNPYSVDMMRVYYAYNALHGIDANCLEYIDFATNAADEPKAEQKNKITAPPLQGAIINGIKDEAQRAAELLIATVSPLDMVKKEIIPALDTVGRRYETGEVYLPKLLMSAESAKAAFEVIKKHMPASAEKSSKGCAVIATVKGDIHDIGKNIVKLLFENYGFEVIDLGKDVPSERVLEAVLENHAPIVGLSALMTTTVPAMEETVKLIREKAPFCKSIVGGAVLTEEYACKIGADKYAKDAMESVRFALDIVKSL